MSMTTTTAVTSLGTLLSDTLQQVSADRLTAAVQQAWTDAYVCLPVWDTSITYTTSAYQYALPATMTVIDAVYITRDTSSFPEEISAELWEVINGQLQFSRKTKNVMADNYPLSLRGKYKLATTDTIPDTSVGVILQNYVLALAGTIVLKQIAYTKALAFINNDTTMGEIIGLRNQMLQDVATYRAQLPTYYVNN